MDVSVGVDVDIAKAVRVAKDGDAGVTFYVAD